MGIKQFTLFLSLLITAIVSSQNETVNWYFGQQTGLNFSATSSNPTILNDGAMITPAGCSTISDNQGNLLFYTNGNTVWNRDHQIMDNGENLAADINNSQTSIIIPKPNDPNTYYIFLTREIKGTDPLLTSGLYYSEVTFSNQFRLGTVTVKNRRILSITTERLTAIHDITSESIKVIAFGSDNSSGAPRDTFFVFTVDSNGVNTSPIKSKVSPVESSKGAMKISPDGKKIALADYDGTLMHIYNYNNATSTVSEDFLINPNIPFIGVKPYGVEFSADSKIVYFTGHYSSGSYLFKFPIYSTDPLKDKILVTSDIGIHFGDLQLAIDSKIYVANYVPNTPLIPLNYVGVINEPENDYEDSLFSLLDADLHPGASLKGLPVFISSFFKNRIISENTCVFEPMAFETDSYMPIDAISWDFGDNTTSSELTPSHTYSLGGNYVVKAAITYNGRRFYLEKNVEVYEQPLIDSGQVLSQCGSDLNTSSFFNLTTMTEKIKNYQKDFTSYFYRSLRDAQNNTNRIEYPESYENDGTTEELFIKIISGEGCETTTNFFIETINNNSIVETPIYTCDETDAISNNGIGRFDLGAKESEIRTNLNIPTTSIITFYASLQNAQTKTSTLPLFYKSESGQIWFRIENENKDCGGIGSFDAIVNSGINANIEETYTLCNSNLSAIISLDGGASNESWEWRDSSGSLISSQRFVALENPGDYSLLVSKTQNNLTCNKTIDFTIQEPPLISFKELRVENNQIIIAIEGGSTYDYSLDGIRFYGSGKDHIFSQVEPGLYTVYVKDKYDCETPVSEKIAFVGYPQFFTPNNDGINDIWKVDGISFDFYNAADITIYDRFGKILHTMDLNSNEVGWDGTFKGKKLITNDYWFKVILTDKDNEKIVTMDHFTLKN